jgi:hypothetical protein
LIVACLIGSAARPAHAAELELRTSQAYDAYLEGVRRAFLAPDRNATQTAVERDGGVSVNPGAQDGIIAVPGGLIHHWVGRIFVRDLALRAVVETSRAYSAYNTVYKSIIASRVVGREADTYRVLMRIKEGEAGVNAVLEIRSTVQYLTGSNGSVLALSSADEIREVQNDGERRERLLPAGLDRGYLWRANTFSRFVSQNDGVYIETETLGLSRRFPVLLGWIIEPIARRVFFRSFDNAHQQSDALP